MWKTKVGHCIYQLPQGLKVFQNFFFRWLTFDELALQTVLNRKNPSKPALSYIKPFILPVKLSNPGPCCMLGLGGAGAAHALSPFLDDEPCICVENNYEVIDIAKKFFMTDRIPNLKIIHQDANIFVQEKSYKFQTMLIDLFDTQTFPIDCATESFFLNCKHRLVTKGILAINIANRHEQWSLLQLIRQYFSTTHIIIPIKNSANTVILASKNESINDFLTRLKKSQAIRQLLWDAKWGLIASSIS